MLCSNEAALQRVYPGMRLSEARAVCADLLWREYDSDLYMKLQTQLIQDLVYASPQVSSIDTGIFLLDASGLNHLGGERKFCRQVQKIANTCGFYDIHIGVADTAFAAQIASKFKHSRHYIVPHRKDKEFISELSIQHLPVSDDSKETFIRLGVKTIGQLLQIPVNEVQERFGKEGLLAVDLAGGIDKTQPQVVLTKEVYEASVDLNFPVESLSQTQFILKSMLERICSKLKSNYLLAEELLISFFNDNDKFDTRPLKLLRPSNNPKFLLELIRLSLEALPLAREYTGLHIEVIKLCNEDWQQNKISILADKPEHLPEADDYSSASRQIKILSITTVSDSGSKENATTSFVAENKNNDAEAEPFALLLQRFITRMGAKSVVRPVPNDQHIPDLASRFLPLTEEAGTVLPINFSTGTEVGCATLACGLILKKAQSAEPLLVEYQGKIPRSISYLGRWFRIKELTEPERLSGLWWENPVKKSYYIALLESKTESEEKSNARDNRLSSRFLKQRKQIVEQSYLVLLVHNHETNAWELDGFFD